MLSLCCRRQAHEKEKKYKVDNNIEPIFLSEAVNGIFYLLFIPDGYDDFCSRLAVSAQIIVVSAK